MPDDNMEALLLLLVFLRHLTFLVILESRDKFGVGNEKVK